MNMVLLHNKKGIPRRVSLFGASDLTRTGDLLITSEMHYRLCYTSVKLPNHYIGSTMKSQLFFENSEIALRKRKKNGIINPIDAMR